MGTPNKHEGLHEPMSIFRRPGIPPILHSGPVKLRPLQASDAPEIMLCCQDEYTQRFTTVPGNYQLKHAQEHIAENQDNPTIWALELTSQPGRWAGSIELREQSFTNLSADLGYMTAPWARGQGAMTAAVKAVSAYAFAGGVHRLELRCYPENTGSIKVAQACGFKYEGTARHATHSKEHWHDLLIHARLSSDHYAAPAD